MITVWTLLQIQFHPHHLPLLTHLVACLGESPDAMAAHENNLQPSAPPSSGAAADMEAGITGGRSFLEDVLAPDPTAVAAEFMSASWRDERDERMQNQEVLRTSSRASSAC